MGATAKTNNKDLPSDNPFHESSLSIKQIDEVMKQLSQHLGDIPPEVERLAIYRIKTDVNDFSQGVSRHIQGRIESILSDRGRIRILAPPELKTLKIVSTDSSLNISNTIPTIEELWKLGDKLRLDAFLDGNCSKTKEGDVLLNLKLIKHRTAEILWSVNLIAGPNKIKTSIFDMKWTIATPLRFYPIAKFTQEDAVIKDMRMDAINIEAQVADALLESRRLYWSIQAGASWIMLSKEDSTTTKLTRLTAMHVGVTLIAIILQKANPDRGYWFATYFGGRWNIPFFVDPAFPTLNFGYKAQLSRRFAISIGGMYLPTQKKISGTGTLPSTKGAIIDLKSFAYEVDLLNYTF